MSHLTGQRRIRWDNAVAQIADAAGLTTTEVDTWLHALWDDWRTEDRGAVKQAVKRHMEAQNTGRCTLPRAIAAYIG